MILIHSFAQTHLGPFPHTQRKTQLPMWPQGQNLASQTSLTSPACLYHSNNTGFPTGPQAQSFLSPLHLDIDRVPSLTSFRASTKCHLLSPAFSDDATENAPFLKTLYPLSALFFFLEHITNTLPTLLLYPVCCLPNPHKKVNSRVAGIFFTMFTTVSPMPGTEAGAEPAPRQHLNKWVISNNWHCHNRYHKTHHIVSSKVLLRSFYKGMRFVFNGLEREKYAVEPN